jgi:glycosyltransferase involved in cell wall biosynthesis
MLNPQNKIVSPASRSSIWVVIPAYNEEKVIGQVLSEVCKKGYSVLVIDDCSKDGTKEIVLQYPVTLLVHSINLGQGAALQTGFEYILNFTDATFIVTFDSDGQHDVEDIEPLLSPVISGNVEVALGSRFLLPNHKSGKFTDIPLSKIITLKLGILFTRISTGLKLTDTHNGLRAFSCSAIKKVKITQNRMAHASEILMQISHKKIPFCEVPVNISYTEYSKQKGQSIFNAVNIIWDLILGNER